MIWYFISKNIPKAHIITSTKDIDLKKYKEKQGSTGKGIAPCAADKFGRVGQLAKGILDIYRSHLLDEELSGTYVKELKVIGWY